MKNKYFLPVLFLTCIALLYSCTIKVYPNTKCECPNAQPATIIGSDWEFNKQNFWRGITIDTINPLLKNQKYGTSIIPSLPSPYVHAF